MDSRFAFAIAAITWCWLPHCAGGELDTLLTDIRGPDHQARYRAFHSLQSRTVDEPDQPRVVEAVMILCDPKGGGNCESAAMALARFARKRYAGIEKAVPVLVRMLDSWEGRDLCEAISALGAIGPAADAAAPVLRAIMAGHGAHPSKAFEDFCRTRAATALGRIFPGDVDAVGFLRKGLAAESEVARWLAADGLGLIGPPAKSAITELRTAMRDPHPTVRVSAACALWNIAGEVETVLPVLERALSEEDYSFYTKPSNSFTGYHLSHRVCAAIGLRDIGPDAAPTTLTLASGLTDSDPGLRGAVARALEAIGPAAVMAHPALRAAVLREPNEDVWQAVHAALKSIEGSVNGDESPTPAHSNNRRVDIPPKDDGRKVVTQK
jgi:HEAT repeat protein